MARTTTSSWGSLAVLVMTITLGLPLPRLAVAQLGSTPSPTKQTSLWAAERSATGTDRSTRGAASPITPSLGTSPDDVTQVLEEAERRPQPLIKFGPLTPLGNAWDGVNKKLDRAIGLNLGLSYAMLYQHAEQAQGSRNASGGNFRFFGRWNFLDRGGKHPGFLGFRSEIQHAFTTIPPSDLGDKLGSLWGTAFGFDKQKFSLVQLWWEQHIFRDRLGLRVGKIDQSDIFATYRFDSFDTDFLNSAFSENPGIAFPDDGLGFIFSIHPRDWFYITFGLGDANGSKTTTGFNTFFNQGEFFYALELGITPNYQHPGKGAYKVTFWHAEALEKAEEPSGRGVALTLEQEIGHGLVPFCRYAFANGKATDVRHFLTAGIGLERPFKRADDLVGLAFAWGQPQDRKLRDQYVLEAFYRVQVFPYIHLTPDLQVIFNPSKNRQDSTIVVLGLRTRVLF